MQKNNTEQIEEKETEIRIDVDKKTSVLLKVPLNMGIEEANGFSDRLSRILKISGKSLIFPLSSAKVSWRGKTKHLFLKDKEQTEQTAKRFYALDSQGKEEMARREFNEDVDLLNKAILYGVKKYNLQIKRGKETNNKKNGWGKFNELKQNKELFIQTYAKFLANKEEQNKLLNHYNTTYASLVSALHQGRKTHKVGREEILKERDKFRNEK